MLIGCGQITWRGAPEEQVLGEVAAAGYDGAPPRLDPSRTAADVVARYGANGLKPAPPYFSAEMWKEDCRGEIVEGARRWARFTREIGCSEMYVAAGGEYRARSGRSRLQAAAKVGPDDALSEPEFDVLVATLDQVGRACLDEGVRACFHQHVGQVIETEYELERLCAATDPGRVFLGPDTGHLAWAGADPVAFCERHRDRIRTLHLKDIDGEMRHAGIEAGWDYRTFAASGIFTELGDGCVDLARLLSILGEPFDGWLVVETDVPRAPTAAESASRSLSYLRDLGL